MFKHRWYVNAWVYNSHIDARHSAHKFLEDNIGIFNEDQKRDINDIVDSFKTINQKLYDNWIYFPYIFWIKDNNKIWLPGDRLIDGSYWTKEMRTKGADILEQIKTTEIEIFNKLKAI
ncbi:MAG: hypothetical protein HeimC3_07460 [Candidatus Heimdallarchaeota archaeon LC_3]|nr:MAG: hypothetical protein HeimC3_07460 [Candidatus Heimdallarchaeota archaeon LC_3]